VAPVATAGPLTTVAALSRPEIKPPGSAGELSLQLRHVATRAMSGSDYFQTSASLSVVALCCCMGHSSPARATPGPGLRRRPLVARRCTDAALEERLDQDLH